MIYLFFFNYLFFKNYGLVVFYHSYQSGNKQAGLFLSSFLSLSFFLFNACYISAIYFLSTQKYPFKAWYYWAAFNHAQQSHVFSAFVWPLFLGMKYQCLNSVTSFHSFIPILVLFLSHWVKLTYCETSPISITSGINLFHCVEAVNTILAGSRLEKARWRPPSQAVCLTAVLIFIFVQQWGVLVFFLPFVPLCPSFHNLPLPFSSALIRTGWSFWLPLQWAKRCFQERSVLEGRSDQGHPMLCSRDDSSVGTSCPPGWFWRVAASPHVPRGICRCSVLQLQPLADRSHKGETEMLHIADGHAKMHICQVTLVFPSRVPKLGHKITTEL